MSSPAYACCRYVQHFFVAALSTGILEALANAQCTVLEALGHSSMAQHLRGASASRRDSLDGNLAGPPGLVPPCIGQVCLVDCCDFQMIRQQTAIWEAGLSSSFWLTCRALLAGRQADYS